MRVRDGVALPGAAVPEVVCYAEEGLDKEEGYDDGTEDGVCCVVQLCARSAFVRQ